MLDNENADSLRAAIYLEIGWSDFLLPRASHPSRVEQGPYPNALYDYAAPSSYQELTALVEFWVRETSLIPNHYCDIGGGPRRTLYELGNRLPSLKQLVLTEPSSIFCDWARKLLTPIGAPPEVPILRTGGSPV